MMVLSLIGAVVIVPVMILIMVRIVMLQIRLSKREHWFPGLIIPIINAVFPLIVMLGMVAYTANVSAGGSEPYVVMFTEQTRVQVILHMITVSTIMNIPTAILLIIYFYQRNQLKKQRKALEE